MTILESSESLVAERSSVDGLSLLSESSLLDSTVTDDFGGVLVFNSGVDFVSNRVSAELEVTLVLTSTGGVGIFDVTSLVVSSLPSVMVLSDGVSVGGLFVVEYSSDDSAFVSFVGTTLGDVDEGGREGVVGDKVTEDDSFDFIVSVPSPDPSSVDCSSLLSVGFLLGSWETDDFGSVFVLDPGVDFVLNFKLAELVVTL